ncbi:hypothetical protein DYB32_008392 [Aphanomyces invadans]|uniref:EF-hand domain-containing protein n=1 Tax=Aphanomyces invadans TaxID=157072 RepID=A0A418ALB5_9STRA|nr:hypothetical protein DYB32_008392 [Aphanomyces invadans]
MERITGLLFDAMDTDENGLVDALEFLGALALLSAMTIPQKITFVYNCYDFNESGEITIDELTLAMKSTLTGLCKLSIGRSCPTELVLEEIALFAFRKAGKHPDKCITLPEYIKYCETTPEVNTWVCFFDAPRDLSDEHDIGDSDVDVEASIPIYSRSHSANMDADAPNDLVHQYAANEEPALTQPWQNTVANAAPTAVPDNPIPLPSMALDWIYGSVPSSRALVQDMVRIVGMNSVLRQCVDYVSTNEIIYPAASVVVLYDHVEHKQRTLLSLGNDAYHTLAIYQWPTSALLGLPQLIYTERTSRYRVLAMQPVTSSLFITCGQRHIHFWYQDSIESSPGVVFHPKPGVLGKKAKMQTLLSVASITDKLTLSGTVLFAHAAAVNVLHVFSGGVVSGGKDGKIRLWSKRMEPGASFDIVVKSWTGKCRSKDPSVTFSHFDLSSTGEWLQVATSKGELVYYDTNSSVENTRLGALKDVAWATLTSIYGWSASNVGEFAIESLVRQGETDTGAEPDTTMPPDQLDMEWVYGYRSHDCRNNLKYTKHGTGIHKRGVVELAYVEQSLRCLPVTLPSSRFNPAGNILASAGSDVDNAIVLYDWELGVVLSSVKSGPHKLLGLVFHPATSTFLAVRSLVLLILWSPLLLLLQLNKQTVLFYAPQGRNLVRKQALMGKRGFAQPFLSVVFVHHDAIVGSTSGELYKFKGIELVTIVPAHTRSVAALAVHGTSVVSGGRDGLVKVSRLASHVLADIVVQLWTSELECVSEWNSVNQMPIRSLAWAGPSLLVGTRDSAIFELSATDGSVQVSVEMHSKGDVQALAVHPVKDKVVTCGDDATLRVWDLYRHRCVLKMALDTASRAVAYSSEGAYVAVGLGGNPRKNRHKKDARHLYQAQKVVLPAALVPHDSARHSFITHVDITSDSQYLRSNCGGFELLFADLTTGSHVASATALKNQTWHTCHTIFNWYNQGAWPAVSTKTTVTASTASATTLVVGDSQGVLKLFRFPCVRDGLPSRAYSGHVGPVQCVSFSQNRSYCVSAGLADHSLIQWKVFSALPLEKDIANPAKLVEADADLETEGWFVPTPLAVAPFAGSSTCFELRLTGRMAGAKPYLSSLIPPSVLPDEPQTFPYAFELEYAYGARLQDVRAMLAYTKSKRLISVAGKVGVSYNR